MNHHGHQCNETRSVFNREKRKKEGKKGEKEGQGEEREKEREGGHVGKVERRRRGLMVKAVGWKKGRKGRGRKTEYSMGG